MTAETSPGPALPYESGPSPAERSARTTLLWGAVVLASGIALVGVGSEDVGAVPVLAGLFLTILGIHTYGRLGPEDGAEPEGGVDPEARGALLQGGLTALAGVAVLLSTYYGAKADSGTYAVAAGAVLAGAARTWMGVHALGEAARRAQAAKRSRRPQAKVEKRRRMDKSPAP